MAHATRRVTVGGRVRPPGDKSIMHRALLLAGVANGASEIEGALAGADPRSTARVLRQLGVAVGPLRAGSAVRVRGRTWREPARPLYCGNSGTTARLMLGLLAGHRFAARLTGDRSLSRRPMGRVAQPLSAMGATITLTGDTLPLTIQGGRLAGIDFRSPVASAQVKSAVLLAGLSGAVDVSVTEPARSRDHTERLLGFLGAPVTRSGATVRFTGSTFSRWVVPPFRLSVPGDFSSAAFLIGAALLADAGELVIERVGVNPTRTGALAVLARMGARIERVNESEEGGEPVADLVVGPAALRGTTVTPDEVPTAIDEVPMLAVLAARARGETRFVGVGELRVKESDRLSLLARNLRAVGAEVAVEGDDLVVAGDAGALTGRVQTAGDHRLAMAFAVLAAVTRGAVEVSERRSVVVSYPAFFDDLRAVLRG